MTQICQIESNMRSRPSPWMKQGPPSHQRSGRGSRRTNIQRISGRYGFLGTMVTVVADGKIRACQTSHLHVRIPCSLSQTTLYLDTDLEIGMMDQLASIGVEFDLPALERCFFQNFKFYHKTPSKLSIKSRKRREKTKKRQWAINPIYENNRPFRPWGLGTISKAPGLLYKLSGQTVRTPGLYRPTDRQSKCDKSRYLLDTNERIHSSVRIRLACKGLGLNDEHVWDCPALLSNWKLKRTREKYTDPVPFQPGWCPNGGKDHMGHPNDWSKGRWVWEYVGNESDGPKETRQRVMVEEPLGPYERYLLSLSAGSPNVYHFADTINS